MIHIFKERKRFKPNTTTLSKYKIVFKTVDGAEHEFNQMNYIDTSTIRCSVGEIYLDNEHFLKDDDGCLYPIENLLEIRFVLVDTIENVIVRYMLDHIERIWYPEDNIEIYTDDDRADAAKGFPNNFQSDPSPEIFKGTLCS